MKPVGSLLEHLESHVEASGSVLRAFWAVFAVSWELLGSSWEPLGASWERLGSILEACQRILRGILMLGKRVPSDLLKYRKTHENTIRY